MVIGDDRDAVILAVVAVENCGDTFGADGT